MSKYRELVNQKVDLTNIKKEPKEIIFNLISCMCDNKYELQLKKNNNGEFRLNMGRFSVSNLQMEQNFNTNIAWAADDKNWKEVVRIIRTGTSAIQSIRSR